MKRFLITICFVVFTYHSFAIIIANKSIDGFRYVETAMSDYSVFDIKCNIASSSLNKVAVRAIQNETTKEVQWFLLMNIRTYLDIPDNSILLLKPNDGAIIELRSVGTATHSETITDSGVIKWTSVTYSADTQTMFKLSIPITKIRLETRWLYVDGTINFYNNLNEVFLRQYREIVTTLTKPANIYDGF